MGNQDGSQKDLDSLRAEIDRLDAELLALLNERARHAQEIGAIKDSTNAAVYVPEREKAVFDALRERNQGPLTDVAVKGIFREVISAIRALERKISVAYLGPAHTFTHKAALCIFGATADFHPMTTFEDIFNEVERGRCDYGIMPVETVLGGGIHDVLDLFVTSDLKIINEIMLHITQNLLSNTPLEKITKIYSKDQAIFQCRNWLKANLPNAELVAVSSTAEAARMAAKEEGAAAIGNDLSAKAYEIAVVKTRIEDVAHNYTRFFVVGKQMPKPSGRDKTSILIYVNDRPGALYSLLLPFADAKINLTRIESRPSRRKAWEYVFFVDLLGHMEDPAIRATLDKIQGNSIELKILGSFPEGDVEQ